MKRRELIKRIERMAKAGGTDMALVREGASHTIFRVGTAVFPIPRHSEINERTAQSILKQAAEGLE